MNTYWHCEKCGGSGMVRHQKHAGVMDVVHRIEDQHKTHRRAVCEFDHFKVRTSERALKGRAADQPNGDL